MPELHRSAPVYMQIVAHYRDLIAAGELVDGDRLPSARQMAKAWNVAHATAAKVLATLRSEGLVRTTPGGAGGTVVSVQPVPQDRMQAVRRTGRIYAGDEHAVIISAEIVEAPLHVAEALEIPVGSRVIRRHRVTYRGETPASVSTSWYVAELAESAPALVTTERLTQGTPGYIEEQTGRRMTQGRDQLTAGEASHEVAEELAVATGSVVLLGRNWIRDQDGIAMEFGEFVTAPGRWMTYEYVIY